MSFMEGIIRAEKYNTQKRKRDDMFCHLFSPAQEVLYAYHLMAIFLGSLVGFLLKLSVKMPS